MVQIQLRVKRYYTYHIIRLALQNNISLRNGNMTTCPTDALKDNQSNPYPGRRKPKPKLPSSVSELISLFWKGRPNSRICINLHQGRSATWNSFVFPLKSGLLVRDVSFKEKTLYVAGPEAGVGLSICYAVIKEAVTCWKRAVQRRSAQAKWFHPLTAPSALQELKA